MHDFAPMRSHRPPKPNDDRMDKDTDSMNIERMDLESYIYGIDSEASPVANPSGLTCAFASNASRLISFWASGDLWVASGRSYTEELELDVFNRSEDLMKPVVLPID